MRQERQQLQGEATPPIDSSAASWAEFVESLDAQLQKNDILKQTAGASFLAKWNNISPT